MYVDALVFQALATVLVFVGGSANPTNRCDFAVCALSNSRSNTKPRVRKLV
jgi:hypothetical protein